MENDLRRWMRLCENVFAVATPAEIDASSKVDIGVVYRGVEGGTNATQALRYFVGGDLGNGIYVTKDKRLAATYGGGPKANIKTGTRVVHAYRLSRTLFPEDVVYLFGGARHDEPVSLVSGTGIELWQGPWQSGLIEAALQKIGDVAIVIGTPDSIGVNQIAVRDRTLLTPA